MSSYSLPSHTTCLTPTHICVDIDSGRCAGISDDLRIASVKETTFCSRNILTDHACMSSCDQ
jgi:hypothetical protein